MGLFDFFKRKKDVGETVELDNEPQSSTKTLEDFFSIDIHKVRNFPVIHELGYTDNNYLINLGTPEIGIFYQIRVIYFPENKCANLVFASDDMFISEQLKELLAFFTDKYGIDNMAKRGYFEDWENGMFSFARLWLNVAMVSAASGQIELTLFDVYQN